MKKPSFATMIILVAVGAVVILLASAIWRNNAPSDYDELAQCITDAGGQVSVAYWCSACAIQEELFGSAWRKLDVRECSSPGSNTFDLCPDITTTPTWKFSDGSTESGLRTPEELADIFNCQEFLP